MKSGWNDPDCAQIDGESSIASVSAESHGLTLEFTFQFSRHFTFDFTFQSNAAVLWGQWERKKGGGRGRGGGSGRGGRSIGKVADAEGRAGVGWGAL